MAWQRIVHRIILCQRAAYSLSHKEANTEEKAAHTKQRNRYEHIIEAIFSAHFSKGVTEFEFEREEIERHAAELGIKLPKNIGDLIYSFRYRTPLPAAIRQSAPRGKQWLILPAGRAKYRFALTEMAPQIVPNEMLAETKVPDATPGVVAMYALNDEQALLARLRYNRLIDIFTRVTCYALQSHLRTTIKGIGQIETDEIYVGVDRRGAHYVFPVQAKGGRDRLSVVQVRQDVALCRHKFPDLICRPVGAQFLEDSVIALFELEETNGSIRILSEKHYRLVPSQELTPQDLARYRAATLDDE